MKFKQSNSVYFMIYIFQKSTNYNIYNISFQQKEYELLNGIINQSNYDYSHQHLNLLELREKKEIIDKNRRYLKKQNNFKKWSCSQITKKWEDNLAQLFSIF